MISWKPIKIANQFRQSDQFILTVHIDEADRRLDIAAGKANARCSLI
jgi:hypothetical protein